MAFGLFTDRSLSRHRRRRDMVRSMNVAGAASRTENDGRVVRLAVLIDADNARAAVIEPILAEVAGVGEATVRRIYGDLTAPQSASWRGVLQRHAIKPVQQFAYSVGKNATDSALIIDAMDLLYTGRFDGFCLVTSDSDFTGLAMRLRESGLLVLGFGERKTPEAFRNACHRFVFIDLPEASQAHGEGDEDAMSDAPNLVAGASATKRSAASTTGLAAKPPFPKKFVLKALRESLDDSGWAPLSTFGNYLIKLQPDFDARLFGYRKLSDLVRGRADLFRVEELLKDTAHPDIYIAPR